MGDKRFTPGEAQARIKRMVIEVAREHGPSAGLHLAGIISQFENPESFMEACAAVPGVLVAFVDVLTEIGAIGAFAGPRVKEGCRDKAPHEVRQVLDRYGVLASFEMIVGEASLQDTLRALLSKHLTPALQLALPWQPNLAWLRSNTDWHEPAAVVEVFRSAAVLALQDYEAGLWSRFVEVAEVAPLVAGIMSSGDAALTGRIPGFVAKLYEGTDRQGFDDALRDAFGLKALVGCAPFSRVLNFLDTAVFDGFDNEPLDESDVSGRDPTGPLDLPQPTCASCDQPVADPLEPVCPSCNQPWVAAQSG